VNSEKKNGSVSIGRSSSDREDGRSLNIHLAEVNGVIFPDGGFAVALSFAFDSLTEWNLLNVLSHSIACLVHSMTEDSLWQ
jgi:hypothetical protein